jgi:glycosyltransferase involved in cell wall biosynthesis
MSKIKVLIDTTPLASGHAIRGIGMYTKQLLAAFEQNKELELVNAADIANTASKPDIIHYPFFDLFAATLPWRRVAPTVVTIHDVIPLVFPDQFRPGKRGRLAFWKQRLALKTVQAVITDSVASKQDVISYLGVPESKIHVVSLAAHPEFKVARENHIKEVRKQYQLPKNYLLYVGDINYNKNIPQLIKSLKFLPDDIHLVCVGKNFYPHDIPEWQWIETQVALSDVSPRVHFVTDIGPKAIDELSAIYTGAVAYIQPSLYEGFGLPVLEAMQCRVPVISARNSSLIEVGGEHATYVEPTAESIAEGVQTVMAWSATARAERVKAANRWSQTFTWQKTAQKTMAVYQQVRQ